MLSSGFGETPVGVLLGLILAALGLIVAILNFALGYPIAFVFHERMLKSLLKRFTRE